MLLFVASGMVFPLPAPELPRFSRDAGPRFARSLALYQDGPYRPLVRPEEPRPEQQHGDDSLRGLAIAGATIIQGHQRLPRRTLLALPAWRRYGLDSGSYDIASVPSGTLFSLDSTRSAVTDG
ncbi:hypothetical protein DPEC_G00252800 [Dallia pectoralis]|uniref:Uncharacterized protein n=1 Tax=Dallia pectoralis TaxID=75939 RepID=A0ACC2FTV1_DALPE|nr:hypothetical protein DPEC_G00252800 [Dallia pectoralis]